jgi:hypothetical protein
MFEKETKDKKAELINRILEIELQFFMTVNPQLTSECQQHPQAFRLMRGSDFEAWSERTLDLYLEHLVDAKSKGRNLIKEKYAKMQNLIPCENFGDVLNEILKINERWQEEVAAKYPNIVRREELEGFKRYLRCELDTFSPVLLESYLNDLKSALAAERNLTIEIYDGIAKKMGYDSLAKWNQQKSAP